MKAILSDIHGNLEALRAVLDDVARHGAEAIYCLGDLIGYGPDHRGCLDLATGWPVVLRGNFDQAVLSGAKGFGLYAGRSIDWTRRQLQAPLPDHQTAARRRDFLAGLPCTHREGGSLFVHGSPRDPLHEYVFPEDIHNPQKLGRIFALVDRYCFQGHTHVPGVFTEDLRFVSPEEAGYVYRLDGRKALVNVGSVGQPRDGDWRACYALLDGDAVRFRRVEYDIETTIRKIRDIDALDDFLGDRLRDGR
jgi:diadenosine tetraphosphatase ApaH/serine/threonine PP2A family protein phosphatase